MGQKKVKKVQLRLNPEPVITLFGIVSTEPDYKISAEINKMLDVSLKSAPQVTIEYGDKIEIPFSRFSDISDLPDSWISIIRNKSNGYSLLRKFPNFDYIAAIFTESEKYTTEEFAAQLRSVKHISAVFLIDKKGIEPGIIEAIMPY